MRLHRYGIFRGLVTVAVALGFSGAAAARTVVFFQAGFPAVETEVPAKETLAKALAPLQPEFVTAEGLGKALASGADLLVLPYGSAFPAQAWRAIEAHLKAGNSLFILGGRPFHVAVRWQDGQWVEEQVGNRYSRVLGIWHTYEAPQQGFDRFAWHEDYEQLPAVELAARRVFVAGLARGAGHYRGMGYLLNSAGDRVAAPVVREDFSRQTSPFWGARMVWLAFEPQPGYWDSTDGQKLIREAAVYAARGATELWLEMHHAVVVPGELPQLVVHLSSARGQRAGQALQGQVIVELQSEDGRLLETATVAGSGEILAESVTFQNRLEPGLYRVRGRYVEGQTTLEAYHTGFWVRDQRILRSGERLQASQHYFSLGGKPFLVLGTNYFTTDVYGASFFTGGNLGGNAWVWERDFSEMARHGLNFARTGIWLNHEFYQERTTGTASERLLRAIEAFLHSAGRHGVQVHFTFFAFDPQTIQRYPGQESFKRGPGSNPYTDPAARRAQKDFIQTIVARFKDVPYVSWDLINEPSFSNPLRLWRGNTPNEDPTELRAWNDWLKRRYGTPEALARAWRIPETQLPGFGSIPLPARDELARQRYGNPNLVRALDYNLFAQEAFTSWVNDMVAGIRAAGGKQLVTVGQDEGGVRDRVLNQFWGGSKVDFTVVHTWWQDDALLWDSLVAKRPDKPNLVGETGVQPVWSMDTAWRWDEVRSLGLLERKLALGFAALNAGSLHWDWSLSDYFGSLRHDGSHRLVLDVLDGLGRFARQAAPYAVEPRLPEIAILLPQSLQLSVFNDYAIEAQQKAVRALYHYARSSAYAVGEYQPELLGQARLIIVPSPWVLDDAAWESLVNRARSGATVLISGRLDAGPHWEPTSRTQQLGLDVSSQILSSRHAHIRWPSGEAELVYSGDKTTYLERGELPGGETFAEKTVGKGKWLYFPWPLELNDNLAAVGAIYRWAMEHAGVSPEYSTSLDDPGILICPVRWRDATLYVLASESAVTREVTFRDHSSGRELSVRLEPGRAALLVVDSRGEILAGYGLPENPGVRSAASAHRSKDSPGPGATRDKRS